VATCRLLFLLRKVNTVKKPPFIGGEESMYGAGTTVNVQLFFSDPVVFIYRGELGHGEEITFNVWCRTWKDNAGWSWFVFFYQL